MIKKLFLLMLMLLPCAAATVQAQYGVGDWKIHATFSGQNVQNVIDTGDKVYYLVSNNLFCYDKTTQENEELNKRNYLSDVLIKQIYYNSYKKYLMVVYDNSNIDVIDSNGKVVNIPDIKDAILTSDKAINDVTFTQKAAYIATSFGYLVLNDTKYEVKESRIYNLSMKSVAVVGNTLLLSCTNGALYYGGVDEAHEYLGTFKSFAVEAGTIFPISNGRFFYTTGYLFRFSMTLDADGNATFSADSICNATPTTLQKTPSGFIANFSPSKSFYFTFDADGNNEKQVSNSSNELLSSATEGKWWALGNNGLRLIDNGTASEYIKPNCIDIALPFYTTFNKLNNKLYVSSAGTNSFFSYQFTRTAVNTYDGTTWADITPSTSNYNTVIPGHSGSKDGTGTYWVTCDPDDADTYYLGSWWYGVLKVKGNEVVQAYNWNNSPLINVDGYFCHGVPVIDRAGTLWITQTSNTTAPIVALPKAKRQLTTVTKSDWITPNISNMSSNKRACVIASKYTDDKVYTAGDYQNPVVFFNDGGNPSSTVKNVSYSQFTDQDEKVYSWNYIYCFAEDQNGKVWMGSDNGIVSFDPKNAYASNFRVNHIKVPRNDGTNLADYLLDGQQVNCIAVDGSNRKWIGTNASGLFLVSADGSQIIKQFNTSNSYLSSNTIYSVCCNPTSNSVYVVTSSGFLEYLSDSTPAEDDYSSVYAYPNPVRPDFTGLITIKGLMDNSLVKITDPAGNVVKQLKSNGGMATWDGCNESGTRVKTGVYFVLASQGDSEGNQSAVTKIMIIR